jgi:hypothetical protein
MRHDGCADARFVASLGSDLRLVGPKNGHLLRAAGIGWLAEFGHRGVALRAKEHPWYR